jgi:hypothetical protein
LNKASTAQAKAVSGGQYFQCTVLWVEGGYRIRLNHGASEYVWPEVFTTFEEVW